MYVFFQSGSEYRRRSSSGRRNSEDIDAAELQRRRLSEAGLRRPSATDIVLNEDTDSLMVGQERTNHELIFSRRHMSALLVCCQNCNSFFFVKSKVLFLDGCLLALLLSQAWTMIIVLNGIATVTGRQWVPVTSLKACQRLFRIRVLSLVCLNHEIGLISITL